MDLLSEEEQWESMKRWLRENTPFILGLVAVGLVGWFGWKWWRSHEDEQAVAANAAYERILATFDERKIPEALTQVEELRKAYPKSAYVSAADLASAKVFVITNQLDKAAQSLERVMNGATDESLRPIARCGWRACRNRRASTTRRWPPWAPPTWASTRQRLWKRAVTCCAPRVIRPVP